MRRRAAPCRLQRKNIKYCGITHNSMTSLIMQTQVQFVFQLPRFVLFSQDDAIPVTVFVLANLGDGVQ